MQSVQLTVEDLSGNTASCTTSFTVDMPNEQFVKMPTLIPLYKTFDMTWPAELPFFPSDTKMQIRFVHPNNDLVFVTPFKGDMKTGIKSKYAVSYLNPNVKYKVEVTIGNYKAFVSSTLLLSIR
jgi:hypothetical protein